ncbi:Aminopyrimidine aminohydrolase [bacterium HR17]|jgi:thiaminase/transcriptional activator TenA|uniref:Aminopyrimidine aminohydrolase n=1 Tax=Candidatus Fervidibacter japonicus TaxID=2035412 RepID=A0A2H5XEH3_9BACT|nr:Aminopyrimidine aminohydrolase [bacterium HR17]
MPFTQQLWQSIGAIFARILDHPFLAGLTDGTLDEDAFRFYVVQDALYLRDFARGLAVLGAKAPDDEGLVMFCDHAKTAIVVERALHESFFRAWGMSAEQVWATPMAPTNLLYTSYLLRVAYERPFYESLGAFLPCYWIYWEVGKALEQRGSPHPLYRRWIETYASAEFEGVVRQVLAVTDRIAATLTDDQRAAMRQHFVTTSRFEWLFWDMAYHREQWRI